MYGYYQEKLHVYHFWELMVNKLSMIVLLWLHIIFVKLWGDKAGTVIFLFMYTQFKGCPSSFSRKVM